MGDSSRHRWTTGAAVAFYLLAGNAVAGDLQQAIETCAAIGEDSDRLDCFDKLASAGKSDVVPVAAEPTQSAAETAVVAEASSVAEPEPTSPPILPKPVDGDDSGGNIEFNVRLTRCAQTSATGRQIYYFDNGEIWRQSNNSRKKVRDCDTPVTVEQDVFGYKMHVASEKRSIRITPVR